MNQKKEELVQGLYDKAAQELSSYLKTLKTKGSEEIINRAYQIASMKDLLMICEEATCSGRTAIRRPCRFPLCVVLRRSA